MGHGFSTMYLFFYWTSCHQQLPRGSPLKRVACMKQMLANRSHSKLPKKASAITDALMPVVEDVVKQLENGMPKPSLFLDSQGNWPLCRSAKCKKARVYACYSEAINKKPAWCSGCKSSNDVCTHF